MVDENILSLLVHRVIAELSAASSFARMTGSQRLNGHTGCGSRGHRRARGQGVKVICLAMCLSVRRRILCCRKRDYGLFRFHQLKGNVKLG